MFSYYIKFATKSSDSLDKYMKKWVHLIQKIVKFLEICCKYVTTS